MSSNAGVGRQALTHHPLFCEFGFWRYPSHKRTRTNRWESVVFKTLKFLNKHTATARETCGTALVQNCCTVFSKLGWQLLIVAHFRIIFTKSGARCKLIRSHFPRDWASLHRTERGERFCFSDALVRFLPGKNLISFRAELIWTHSDWMLSKSHGMASWVRLHVSRWINNIVDW